MLASCSFHKGRKGECLRRAQKEKVARRWDCLCRSRRCTRSHIGAEQSAQAKTEVLVFSAFDLQFPILTATLTHFDGQLRLTTGLKAEVEVVADCSAVDFGNAVAGLELKLSADSVRRHFRDLS